MNTIKDEKPYKNFEFSYCEKLKDINVTKKAIAIDELDELIKSNKIKSIIEQYRTSNDKKLKVDIPEQADPSGNT
jgi:hypothetical protein